MPAPNTSNSFPFVFRWSLVFLLRSISSPKEDDLSGLAKLSETVAWDSSLLASFFLAVIFPPFCTKCANARLLLCLDSKSDEAKDASGAAKDVDVTPTAPSWCGGGNFSLLLVTFTLASIFRRWEIESDTLV